MNGLSILIDIPFSLASILGLKKGETLKDSPIGWGVFELPTSSLRGEIRSTHSWMDGLKL